MRNTKAPKTLIPAIRKKTFCHVDRVDCWDVKAPTTIGPAIAPRLATVFTMPMIFPAWTGARSSWLVITQLNTTPMHTRRRKKIAIARARLQPTNRSRIRKQSAKMNPAKQEIFRTTVVDKLPLDRSQSAITPVTGHANDPKNGTADNAPLFFMSRPRTSCMYRGRQVIKLQEQKYSASKVIANAHTGTDVKIFRHGVGGCRAKSTLPIIFSQYSCSAVDIRGCV